MLRVMTVDGGQSDERSGEPSDERSVGDLVQQASQQLTDLVRQEIRLARLEMRGKVRHAGRGAGLFGAGGILAVYGGGALVAAVILVLALVIEPWVSALIVAAVLLAAAGVLALSGKHEIDDALPPTPEQASESVREDVRYLQERTSR